MIKTKEKEKIFMMDSKRFLITMTIIIVAGIVAIAVITTNNKQKSNENKVDKNNQTITNTRAVENRNSNETNEIDQEKSQTSNYDDDGLKILEEDEVNSSDFIGTWEADAYATEISIYDNGNFVMDHYTASSELKGTYTINGASIVFSANNGNSYTGLLESDEAGNKILKIAIDGKKVVLYNVAGNY